MKKTICRGCGRNFASETMFFHHRTGEYSYQTDRKLQQSVGTSPRRCLTVDEMQALGWELVTVDVDVVREGIRKTQPMKTWVQPGQIEARQERMKKVAQSRLKHAA